MISTIIGETKESALDDMTVAKRAEQLLTLLDRKNSLLAVDEKAAIVRPETLLKLVNLSCRVKGCQLWRDVCGKL